MISTIKTPPIRKNMNIGLFGGSFNPPHNGHILISEEAIRRFSLDQLWWLISPQNPLKSKDGLKPLNERVQLSNELIKNRKIKISLIEKELNINYSADLIWALKKRFSEVNFIWLMGADNLAQFHKWKNWESIINQLPIAIFDRPSYRYKALNSSSAKKYAKYRINNLRDKKFASRAAPCLYLMDNILSYQSSTKIRQSDSC